MRLQELSPISSSPDNMMGQISMKVLDMALENLTDTGAGLANMIEDIPAATPASGGIMNAEHIDMLV